MFKGYRTILFNLLAAILPVMQASGADLGLTGNALELYTATIAFGNIILRIFTTTPVTKKE